MIYVVIIFLWLSVCLYLILGGADFGAGIVEFLSPKKFRRETQKSMYKAIGPIWEANHMWLIIAIVILFVGFPTIYSMLSTYLHIPLVLMLLGIIARGTAFTFRNYDAVKDDWNRVYTSIFLISSIATPFFLGLIAASTVSGYINPNATDFLSLYVKGWLNPFGISVGIFTVALCVFLAASFSIASLENESEIKRRIKEIYKSIILVVVTGTLVFATAYFSGIPLLIWIFSKPLGIAAVLIATSSLLLMYFQLRKKQFKWIKILVGIQIMMILIAATYQHFPNIVILANGNYLSLFDEHAAEKTIQVLAIALLIGSLFILPFLFYLMFSFSFKHENEEEENH